MSARVAIDPDLCIGSSECVRLVPEAFVLDEERGVSRPRPAAQRTPLVQLLVAASSCPTGAITVDGAGAEATEG